MNRITLIGNAGKDPEITTVKGDRKVAKFSLAVNEFSKNEKGEKVTNTTWFNCVAWDKSGETLATYLKKGQKVFIEGRLSIREYEKDQVKGKSIDVVVSNFVLLGNKEEGSAPASAPAASAAPAAQSAPAPVSAPGDLTPDTDDLPF